MDESFENWLKERTPDEEIDDGRLSPGTVIGAYRIETFLGKGGFAEVYGARSSDGERVAIKILHRLDEQSRLRFERESNVLSQIHHPNIPRLLSFGSCGSRPYLVTEMLEVRDLPRSDKAVAKFIRDICMAADALHKAGYIHRDIKPSNVLWRGDTPVLIDFGLVVPISETRRRQSELSVEGGCKIAVGTLRFSAPEQFAGQVSGVASDIHAIGALIGACFDTKMSRCWKHIYLTATNSNPDVRYQRVVDLCRAITLRHVRKMVMLFLFVILVGVTAYTIMEGVQSYCAENRTPHRFQEST